MRVEWTLPDEAKRGAARKQMVRDVERLHSGNRLSDMDGLDMKLADCRTENERALVWSRRYPDLDATITRFGTLLSVRHVPAQYAARHYDRGGIDLGTTGVTAVKLCEARWVALVATETGTVEMDPITLRVMWSSARGDQIGGIVDPSEITRRGATRAENIAALEYVLDAYK